MPTTPWSIILFILKIIFYSELAVRTALRSIARWKGQVSPSNQQHRQAQETIVQMAGGGAACSLICSYFPSEQHLSLALLVAGLRRPQPYGRRQASAQAKGRATDGMAWSSPGSVAGAAMSGSRLGSGRKPTILVLWWRYSLI
jgi:hypothetical protein